MVDHRGGQAQARESYPDDFVRDAKEHLLEYVEWLGYPAKSRSGGRSTHICPCCGSGSGNNNNYTPAFNVYRGRNGDLRWKCFACNNGGSIFDLAGIVNHVDAFPQKMRAVADFLDVDLSKHEPVRPVRAGKRVTVKPIVTEREFQRKRAEFARYVKESIKHVGETDFFERRALAPETVERFFLGYDACRHAAVIPYVNPFSHTVDMVALRYVDVGANEKTAARKHFNLPGGRKIIFNIAALGHGSRRPVFIAEAPLDAMSIVQAGGEAIALGGTGNDLLLKLIETYDLKGTVFVIALDSDDKGRMGAARIAEQLDALGVRHVTAEHPCFTLYHDANEALMNDPCLLEKAVAHEEGRAADLVVDRSDPFPFRDEAAPPVPSRLAGDLAEVRVASRDAPLERRRGCDVPRERAAR